jgi:hypothetical protein
LHNAQLCAITVQVLLKLTVFWKKYMIVDYGLRQRVALITGCTSPLGSSVAQMLAAQGAWIALNYFADNVAAKGLLDAIRCEGGRGMLAAGSVRDAEGTWKVARYVELEWAQIDILVHTASLLNGAEAVDDPEPLLAELLPSMQSRHWGRVVIFGANNMPIEQHGDNVLINGINIVSQVEDEALARLVLFLTSEWNMCLSGQTLNC